MLYYKYALQVRAQKCLVLINEVILIISKFQNFLVCYWILCIHNKLIFEFHIDIKSETFNNLFCVGIDFDDISNLFAVVYHCFYKVIYFIV